MANEPTKTYVVQIAHPEYGWTDLATVDMPCRSKRKAVIARALEMAPGAKPAEGETARLRVLDEASARITPVRALPQDPVLEIG
jgi:hypothetical protein